MVPSTVQLLLRPAATVALSTVAPLSQQPRLLHLRLDRKAILCYFSTTISRCSPLLLDVRGNERTNNGASLLENRRFGGTLSSVPRAIPMSRNLV